MHSGMDRYVCEVTWRSLGATPAVTNRYPLSAVTQEAAMQEMLERHEVDQEPEFPPGDIVTHESLLHRVTEEEWRAAGGRDDA